MASDLLSIIRETYRKTIETHPMPTELRRALKCQERIPALIDNLQNELRNPQFKSREQIEGAVRDMTLVFVRLVDQQALERSMSDIKKLMVKQKADEQAALDKAADALNAAEDSRVEKSAQGETDVSRVEVSTGIL